MMVASPRNCAETADRVCNGFLPAVDKDPHLLRNACSDKECSTEDQCVMSFIQMFEDCLVIYMT